MNDGPMQGCTTSFEIKNGSQAQFMKEFEKLGFNNIKIQFYDGGYTEVMKGLTSTKNTAQVLILVSFVCNLVILSLFVFLQTNRQKINIGIGMSLGLTRRLCVYSMFCSILPIVGMGVMLGCAIGAIFTERFQKLVQNITSNVMFERTLSTSVNAADKIINNIELSQNINIFVPITLAIIILATAILISLFFIIKIVKVEPSKLLSGKLF